MTNSIRYKHYTTFSYKNHIMGISKSNGGVDWRLDYEKDTHNTFSDTNNFLDIATQRAQLFVKLQ